MLYQITGSTREAARRARRAQTGRAPSGGAFGAAFFAAGLAAGLLTAPVAGGPRAGAFLEAAAERARTGVADAALAAVPDTPVGCFGSGSPRSRLASLIGREGGSAR